MDRLTKRIDGKLVLKKKFPSLNDTVDILASRLELYEGTGLSPEQVRELQEQKEVLLDTVNMLSPLMMENRELKEKQIPKKPKEVDDNYSYFVCPVCDFTVGYMDDKETHNYCLNCGQRINWN